MSSCLTKLTCLVERQRDALRGGEAFYHPSCREDLDVRFGYRLTEDSFAQLLSLSPAVQIFVKPLPAAGCVVGPFPTATGCLCALL